MKQSKFSLKQPGYKMTIREAQGIDFDLIWSIFSEITSVGETYAYPTDISKKMLKTSG